MANINLRPWREERRTQRNQEFIITLVVFLVLVGGGSWYWVHVKTQTIANQLARNVFLQQEIRQKDATLVSIRTLQEEINQFVERMAVIQELQDRRPLPVQVLDALVAVITTQEDPFDPDQPSAVSATGEQLFTLALPEGLHLESVELRGNNLTITGVAERSTNISRFLRNLGRSPFFVNPDLRQQTGIDGPAGQSGQRFVITAGIRTPKAEVNN